MTGGLKRRWLRTEEATAKLARRSSSKSEVGWREQEAAFSQIIPGGQVVPGSGSSSRSTRRGDVDGRAWVMEAKTTSKGSIRLQRSWLQKICVDAAAKGKFPLLGIGFDATNSTGREDWVAMPAELAGVLLGVQDAVARGDFETARKLAGK